MNVVAGEDSVMKMLNQHCFNSNEVDKESRLIEQQDNMQLLYKSINYNDINIIIENSTLGECREMIKFTQHLSKVLDCKCNGEWNDNFKLLYMFKLGVMQGKREERLKKKTVVGGAI